MRTLLTTGLAKGLAMGLVVLALPGVAPAADMIDYGEYRQARPAKTYREVTHVRYEVCNDLTLTYRPPYEPRHVSVRLCHPPLPGE